tara:strand:- start:18070 stop:18498 length:429 start_codon:yes stop_codon:yes gene_type:complete
MDKPNIVLNIVEKNENNDKIENNNNQKQNSNKEKSSNNDNSTHIDKDYNDTNRLSNEQKKKLQSWIDSEEESKIELEKLRLQHELLFKNIDLKIENNNNKIRMKTLMNNILNTKNKTKKSFHQKHNSKKQKSFIKPYALKLF